MRASKSFLLGVVFFLGAFVCPGLALDISSPDGQITVSLVLRDLPGAEACPVYRVDYGERRIVTDSRLGFALDSGVLQAGLSMTVLSEGHHDSLWKPVYGENGKVEKLYALATAWNPGGFAVMEVVK